MASTPLPLLALLSQGRTPGRGSTFIPDETNELVRELILEQIPDVGRDPIIESILTEVNPARDIQNVIQRPIDSLLKMVGLDPSGARTPAAGAPGATPPTFPGRETASGRVGEAISGAASTILPFLIARNNPQVAAGVTQQGTVLEEQRRGRVGQLLSEIQSRRQAQTQRQGQEIQRQAEDRRGEREERRIGLEEERLEFAREQFKDDQERQTVLDARQEIQIRIQAGQEIDRDLAKRANMPSLSGFKVDPAEEFLGFQIGSVGNKFGVHAITRNAQGEVQTQFTGLTPPGGIQIDLRDAGVIVELEQEGNAAAIEGLMRLGAIDMDKALTSILRAEEPIRREFQSALVDIQRGSDSPQQRIQNLRALLQSIQGSQASSLFKREAMALIERLTSVFQQGQRRSPQARQEFELPTSDQLGRAGGPGL